MQSLLPGPAGWDHRLEEGHGGAQEASSPFPSPHSQLQPTHLLRGQIPPIYVSNPISFPSSPNKANTPGDTAHLNPEAAWAPAT